MTDSKLKNSITRLYCRPVFSTCMKSTSCEMLGWMNHNLESRFLGEISTTSDIQSGKISNRRENDVMARKLQEETWVLYAHPGKYLPFSISTSMTTKSGPPRSSLSPSTDPRLRFAFRVSRQLHIKRETTGASPFQEQRQHLPRVLERIQSLIQVPCVISSPYLHGTSVQGNGRI